MNPQYSLLDFFVILLYIFSLLLIGFIRKNKKTDYEDYLIAGRRVTLPLFVMTLVSTWYGGILGVGEFTYLYGLSNWFVFGMPYYVFAIVFALFLAKKLHRSQVRTIPELVNRSMGRRGSIMSALLVFLLVSPAPYLLGAGMIFSHILPGSTLIWAILIYAFSALYLYRKGFESVIQTDVLQFIIMFAGFILLLGFSLWHYPIHNTFINNLPADHFSLNGGQPVTYLISWFFIALWTLVDPGFHQRVSAAKSVSVARNGILVSVLFWAFFDLLTLLTGLYARALLPTLSRPILAFPALAEHLLPTGLLGLFTIGLLATVMSTLDSYIFISAQTIGNDLMLRAEKSANMIRWGYVITGIIAIALLILIPSIVNLWYTLGTLIIPALLIPVLASLNKAIYSQRSILPVFGIPLLVTGFWFTMYWINGHYPMNIEAFYPGMLSSGLINYIALKTKRASTLKAL